MKMQNLPNLFPYFERNENPKYVRLGVMYSIIYAVSMLVIMVLWVVVLVLPDATVTYDPHTYPVDYQPGEELKEPIPLEKIHSLYNDKVIREVRCMCTNEDPAFGDNGCSHKGLSTHCEAATMASVSLKDTTSQTTECYPVDIERYASRNRAGLRVYGPGVPTDSFSGGQPDE